jgi:Na+-transporting methylmalonyl-CoA/oxaloacetate decarboxylase gamma subunit
MDKLKRKLAGLVSLAAGYRIELSGVGLVLLVLLIVAC